MQHRNGFTLFELMVALVLGAGVLLGGRLLIEQAIETNRAMTDLSAKVEADMRHERVLRELFRNIEIGTGDSVTFGGTEHEMWFTSWCDSASGLRGRCRVTLAVDTAVWKSAVGERGNAELLMRDSVPGVFRYLSDARAGGQWFRTWGEGILAPLAIGIVFGRDTTVLRIGVRG